MIWLIRFFYIIGPCLYITAVQANPSFTNWYQIDMVMFKQPGTNHSLANIPNNKQPYPLFLDNTIELLPAAGDEILPYQLLPRESQKLSDAARQLEKQGYDILRIVAWRQPIPKNNTSKPVRLFGGKTFLRSVPWTSTPLTQWELEGTFFIDRQQFLKAHLHLLLTTSFSTQDEYRQSRLLESREIRPNELHYFDNPYFGILLFVSTHKSF